MSSAQIPTTAFPQLGRYQLVQKLGEGGMGAVYLAQDTHLNRQVAVKILPPHSVNNPDAIGRFQREARALAQLSHPNIIQAHDAGAENGQHFLVMEYVEGKSLAMLLQEQTRLSPMQAASYVHQAALALEHAHEKGLIHRDLKPSNLLITKDGQVKLLDLGLARFLQDQLGDAGKTREGVGLGTPDYAPPEQFRDAHNVDRRADIYSLGCTLYELLTGKVPFPGTSLSEKYKAHATEEPLSLEAHGVDAPGGLVLVLQKMMAKTPAERYQTASAVADDLLPYVSASSSSFQVLKSTGSWHVGQLTMPEFPRRRRWLPWAITGVAVMAALVLLAVVLTNALRPGTPPAPQVAQEDPKDKNQPEGNKPDPKKPDPKKLEKETKPVVERDPNIRTVSKTEKDHAEFSTISEALRAVQPGQTIRVLDDAVYQESLEINRKSHVGLRLEAPRHAVLELVSGHILIHLSNVSGVTLCGFQCRFGHGFVNPDQAFASGFILVEQCDRIVLERLTLEGSGPIGLSTGIEVFNTGMKRKPGGGPSLVIRNNVIRRIPTGIMLAGCLFNLYNKPTPVEGVLIRDNELDDCGVGVYGLGTLRRVQIVGNRVTSSDIGLQLENLLDRTANILVANNTLVDCPYGVRSWDTRTRGENVQIRNNLVLASQIYDFYVSDSGGAHNPGRGAGNGPGVATVWQLDHNWREGKKPSRSKADDKGWIPPTEKDVLREKIDAYDNKPKSPHYLRPAKDSDLATKGAGNEEPSLPRYVGAVPPEGVEPWDWERTWLAWPGTTKLLTVSKDTKDGATSTTINGALKKANPWDTIRVLDGATYAETIAFTDKDKHEGLCLETVGGATLQLPDGELRLLTINNVPHVRVSGFRLSGKGPRGAGVAQLVSITGNCSGVQLSQLHLHPGMFVEAVRIQNVVADTAKPLRMHNCRVTGEHAASQGLVIVGSPGGQGVCGVQVADCRISVVVCGVDVLGLVRDIQVVGNQIWQCSAAGLQTQDLHPNSTRLLFASNSVLGCNDVYHHWENEPYPKHVAGQMEISNNLFARARNSDVQFVQCPRQRDDKGHEIIEHGDALSLQRLWRFRRNYRDCSGLNPVLNMPLAKEDRLLNIADLESTALDAPDRWRPKKNSNLAKDGAGVTDTSLPVYVGALPPEGVEPWNWDWTWQARTPRESPLKK